MTYTETLNSILKPTDVAERYYRITFEIDKTIHKTIKKLCIEKGLSIKDFITSILLNVLKMEDKND